VTVAAVPTTCHPTKSGATGTAATATASATVTGVNAAPSCFMVNSGTLDVTNEQLVNDTFANSNPDADAGQSCSISLTGQSDGSLVFGATHTCSAGTAAYGSISYRIRCPTIPAGGQVVVALTDGWVTTSCERHIECVP
jgi:hypothetical protein